MAELFESGRVVGLILAFIAVEAVVLVAYHRRTGRGVAPDELLPNLAAGVFLLLALGSALAGAGWGWIAAALSSSLVAHLADLRRRSGRATGSRSGSDRERARRIVRSHGAITESRRER